MAVDYLESEKAFTDQNELLDVFSDILDLHIYYLYKYHAWVGPDDSFRSMMGAAVTRGEFESNLMRAADSYCMAQLNDDERAELHELGRYFMERVRATVESNAAFPAITLIGAFSPDRFQLFVILTLACCEMSQKYETIFSFLQNDAARKRPTAETLIRLFAKPLDRVSDYFRYFSGDSLLSAYFLTLDNSEYGALRLSPRILTFLTEAGRLEGVYEYRGGSDAPHPLYAGKDLARLVYQTAKNPIDGKTLLIFFSGRRGSGRRFQVKHCAAALGESVIFADIAELCSEEKTEEGFYSAVCARVLKKGSLCLTGFEYLLTEENEAKLIRFRSLLKKSRQWLGPRLYITSEEKWTDDRLDGSVVKIDFELPEIGESERLSLWEAFMNGKKFADGAAPRELAAKFRFVPEQICAAAERAELLAQTAGEREISADLLYECCYAQIVDGLSTLAEPIKPAYSWEDIVLPERETNLLKEACAHVTYHQQVYGAWGFGKKAAYGQGLSLLFSGPPGTGKTMAAQVIAKQLRMRMYKIRISRIVSKYIGETEKNLQRVFAEARAAGCILFFDEMDALFGKRTEIKDSHDRSANIETAYLLQQLEEYDGVILMATNLFQNIDEAFIRRINFIVSFPFPDIPARKRLWIKMLDTGAPVAENIDYDFLAECFKMAGGNIKNCAVQAAFLAAAENAPISMRHLVGSALNELRKDHGIVLREDLKEYADLAFDVIR